MTRIKGGILHAKRRRGILKHTKGYRWGRKSKIKLAKTAKMKAGQYAFDSRRTKKRINRGLWNVRINAAVRKSDMSYSELMGLLKKKGVSLDRKVLSEIAQKFPALFNKIVEVVR
ncbi:MAG TPA: 50S ribosomal protein L20 [Patescibacteria group bacterium]|nr:50S ribosomal protein L20 [Patescibacteria group bacterium]